MYKTVSKPHFMSYLCLIVLNILQHANTENDSFYAISVPELKDQTFTTNNYSITTRSEIYGVTDCMVCCADENICLAFGYNVDTSECNLYSTPFMSLLNTIESPGWSYYIQGSVACPIDQGFVYDRVNYMCLHLSSKRYTYTDGKAYCKYMLAAPIHLETEGKKEAIQSFLAPLTAGESVKYRIGLLKDGDTWKWDGGEEETSIDWKVGEPYCPPGELCECTRIWSDHQWALADYDCEASDKIICEYPVFSPMP